MAEAPERSPFKMHAARQAKEAGAVHIEEQVQAIEQAVTENPGLAFDLAKTLIESTCKAILTERGHGYEGKWDLPRLLKEALSKLRLVPDNLMADASVSGTVKKTVGGLQTVIQGVCELRNTHGFASHGKDPSFHQLDQVQALLVARAADAVVGFLFRVHWEYSEAPATREFGYGDHPEFNDYVDEASDLVRIFDLEYRPSEVLFQVDPQAYRHYLASYEGESGQDGSAADKPKKAEVTA